MKDPIVADLLRRHNDRQDRAIRLHNRTLKAKSTAREIHGRHNIRISGHTIRRRLRVHGMHSRPILKRQLIYKQRHRAARLNWARARRR